MKRAIVLICSILCFIISCDDDSNPVNSGKDYGEGMDYEIYKIVVSHTFHDSNAAFVLRDSTIIRNGRPEEYLYENFTTLEEETVTDFYVRNSQRIPLKHIPGFPNCILSRDFEGESFQYPYVTLSAIGYNDGKTQALVEMGVMSGPLAGEGSIFLIEHEEGTWVIKMRLMTWIS